MIFNRQYFSEVDWRTLGAALALSCVGLVMVYSASHDASQAELFWKQAAWLAAGLVLCIMLLLVDYHTLTDHVHFLYGLALLSLLAVAAFGTEVHGHRSWLRIGAINLQPSEFVKIVTILVLARLFSGSSGEFLSRREIGLAAAATALPMALVVLEGDVGSAAAFVPIFASIAMVCGLRRRLVAAALAGMLCLAPVAWFSMKQYQRQRIITTFQPELDPLGAGYQAQQSRIAIGSGGVLGKGVFQGSQSQLGFLPARHTDFVFAVLAEETGLLGTFGVLGLYLWMLWRMFGFARTARDRPGILIVVGVASLLAFHVVVNVGMAVGLLPITGLPLPLMSYGGSSMLATFAGLGLVLNVQARRFFY